MNPPTRFSCRYTRFLRGTPAGRPIHLTPLARNGPRGIPKDPRRSSLACYRATASKPNCRRAGARRRRFFAPAEGSIPPGARAAKQASKPLREKGNQYGFTLGHAERPHDGAHVKSVRSQQVSMAPVAVYELML